VFQRHIKLNPIISAVVILKSKITIFFSQSTLIEIVFFAVSLYDLFLQQLLFVIGLNDYYFHYYCCSMFLRTLTEVVGLQDWIDGWLGFNGILSTQVAAISCLRKFKVY